MADGNGNNGIYGIQIEFPPIIDRIELNALTEYRRALADVGDLVIGEVSRQFVRKRAVATTGTIGSIQKSGVTAIGSRLLIEVAPTGNRRRAMQAIEFGRRKNKPMPPLGAIIEWMDARGISGGMTPSEQRSIAYAIAVSIAEHGIKPKHIFKDTINDTGLQTRIQNVLAEATRRVVAGMNNGNSN